MKIGEVRHSSLSSRVLCPGAAGTAPSAAVSATPVDRVGSTSADDGRPRGGSHSSRRPLRRVASPQQPPREQTRNELLA